MPLDVRHLPRLELLHGLTAVEPILVEELENTAHESDFFGAIASAFKADLIDRTYCSGIAVANTEGRHILYGLGGGSNHGVIPDANKLMQPEPQAILT